MKADNKDQTLEVRRLARLSLLVSAAISFCFLSSGLSCEATEGASTEATHTAAPQSEAKDVHGTGEATLETVLEKLSTTRKNLKTVKADVVFEWHILALDIKEIWTGKLLFKLPRLLNLEVKTKDEEGERRKKYIIGKKYAWIYTQDIDWEQVEKYKLASLEDKDKSAANPLEYGLAADMEQVRKVYDVSYEGAEAIGKRQTHKLQMVPKDKDADLIYSKVVLWIDDTLWLPTKIEQHKSDGEEIEIYLLSNIQLNKRISNAKFRFKKPWGVTELDYSREE